MVQGIFCGKIPHRIDGAWRRRGAAPLLRGMSVSPAPSNAEERNETLSKYAGAMRAKYRVGLTNVSLQSLGVHQRNRSGVFPQAARLEKLMLNIFENGFCKETANHQGVCVQEFPPDEQPPPGYVNMHAWNVTCSKRHTHLEKLIGDSDRVTHGTLSRSHLTVILKLFKNKQCDWPWPEQYKALLTSTQELTTAVAAIDQSLADVLIQGPLFEILSWKIVREEPDACSKISQALNMSNEVALATAETTAIAVLSETITFALTNERLTKSAQRTLAFDAIKASVQDELRVFTKTDDFIELFEYVMNLGANNAPYIPRLVEFMSVWVNSEEKRLSLSAFKEPNKISNRFPRTKVAMIQRAYMKQPNNQGVCPAPESYWSKVSSERMEKLESLLKYFTDTLSDTINSMGIGMAQHVRSTAVVSATNAFISNVPIPGEKRKEADIEKAMLRATLEDYEKIAEHLHEHSKTKIPPPEEGSEWIDYAAAKKELIEEKAKAEAEEAARGVIADKQEPILAKCIAYDSSGNALDAQDTKLITANKASIVEVPWSAWLSSRTAQDMGVEKALQSAVNIAMQSLHQADSLPRAPLQIMLNEQTKKYIAIATADIDANFLQLPPCAPGKGSKLSSEPKSNSVAITIEESQLNVDQENKKRMKTKSPEGSNASSSIKTTTHTFYVSPDTKLPQWESTIDTAVADGNQHIRVMKPLDGSEIMHPFWMLTRMTERDLKSRNLEETKASKKIKFNCELVNIPLGVCSIGMLMGKRTNITWDISVPIITNKVNIKKGDELVLMIEPPIKKEKEQQMETWKSRAKRPPTGNNDEKKAKIAKGKGKGDTNTIQMRGGSAASSGRI